MGLEEFVMTPQGIPRTCGVAHILKFTCVVLRKRRWLPGSSHGLDLKSTRLVVSGCGMQLRLALLDGIGVPKVVAWVQSCTGAKVHEASRFFV